MIRTADTLRNLLLSTEWNSPKMVAAAADVHETVTALTNEVESLNEILDTVNEHVAESCRILGDGNITDSWALLATCKRLQAELFAACKQNRRPEKETPP